MATLDIKASTLRAKEAPALKEEVERELANARLKTDQQEKQIAELLSEKTMVEDELAGLEAKLRLANKKNETLAKKVKASKDEHGNP